jgi:hypothetical protein
LQQYASEPYASRAGGAGLAGEGAGGN